MKDPPLLPFTIARNMQLKHKSFNMSWLKKRETSPGVTTVSVCLLRDDEYEAVISEIQRQEFDRLVFTVGEFDDLNFLAPIKDRVRYLMLQGTVTTSLSGIENLTNLREFDCDTICTKPYPNFGKLHNLEKCFLAWDKKYDVNGYQHGLFTLPKLKDLTLRYWSNPDCVEIAQLERLEKLDLRRGVVTRLHGLEICSRLRTLELAYLPKLTDISQLEDVKSLEQIRIENCPNIADYGALTRLRNLRHIHLGNV